MCTKDGTELHSNFLLSSYIGHIPECEGMCNVKRNPFYWYSKIPLKSSERRVWWCFDNSSRFSVDN